MKHGLNTEKAGQTSVRRKNPLLFIRVPCSLSVFHPCSSVAPFPRLAKVNHLAVVFCPRSSFLGCFRWA